MSRSELLLPPPDDRLHLWPVSKRVNRTGNVDGPRPFIVPQINSKIQPRAAGCSTNRPSNWRAPDYKFGGREFESLRARQFERHPVRIARHSHDKGHSG